MNIIFLKDNQELFAILKQQIKIKRLSIMTLIHIKDAAKETPKLFSADFKNIKYTWTAYR